MSDQLSPEAIEALILQVNALKQRVFDLNMEIANRDMELMVTRAQLEAQGPTPVTFLVKDEEELEA